MDSNRPARARQAAATPAPGRGVALLVIDMQHDFVRGSLKVPAAEALLPLLNQLAAAVAAAGGAVAASQDWHPPDHVSFVSSHPGHQVFDTVQVEVGGCHWPIQLFPTHCMAGTPGAELAEGLDRQHLQHIVRKGQQAGLESFSAFYDMAHTGRTGLAAWLREQGVHTVLVCGVATEYCVRATVLDSLAEGFATALLTDAVAGVDEGACRKAVAEMQRAGALLMRGADLLGQAGTVEPGPEGGGKAAAAGRAPLQLGLMPEE